MHEGRRQSGQMVSHVFGNDYTAVVPVPPRSSAREIGKGGTATTEHLQIKHEHEQARMRCL